MFERRASKNFIERASRPMRGAAQERSARARDELKKSETWLRQKAAALEAEATGLLKDAAEFRRLADAMRAQSVQDLPKSTKTRSLILMDSTHAAEGAGRWRGRPPKTKHPFSVTLRERDSHPKLWAEAHDVPYSTVKSWFASGAAARAIPRKYAELIQHELGLPATISTWKNGITE